MPHQQPLLRFYFHGSLAIVEEERAGRSGIVELHDDSCWQFNEPRDERNEIEAPFWYHPGTKSDDTCSLTSILMEDELSCQDTSSFCTTMKKEDKEAVHSHPFAPVLEFMLSSSAIVDGVRDLSNKIDYMQERAEQLSRKLARLGPHRVRG